MAKIKFALLKIIDYDEKYEEWNDGVMVY